MGRARGTAEAARNDGSLRTCAAGIPPSALVIREEGRWVTSPARAQAALTRAFEVRLRMLHEGGLPENAFLPFELQKKAQKLLQQEWASSARGRQLAEAAASLAMPCFLFAR